MVSVSQAISWYNDWIGYRDNGGTKMWMLGEKPHWPGSAWCGKTQEVLCSQLQLTLSPTTNARIVFVPNVVNDARAAGKWKTSYKSNTGDWVIFDWLLSGRRDGWADHIGMVLRNDPSLPYIDTIEGNTLDENGVGPRGLFVRRRYRVDILGCVDRQHAYSGTITPLPPVLPLSGDQDLNKWIDETHRKILQTNLHVVVDGIVGKQTITALQKKLGTTADGEISGPASRMVVALQKKIGLSGADVDGILGPKTGSYLEKYLDKGGFSDPVVPTPIPVPPKPVVKKLVVDGYAGPVTIKALQKYLKTTQDGIISGQDAGWHRCLPSEYWTSVKWQSPGKAAGSRAVVALQKKLHLSADGIIGVGTAKAFQRWVGVTADGILGPKSVKALQRKLNTLV